MVSSTTIASGRRTWFSSWATQRVSRGFPAAASPSSRSASRRFWWRTCHRSSVVVRAPGGIASLTRSTSMASEGSTPPVTTRSAR